MITYASVCSGIESASVAWEPLGFSPVWFSEIEPFPCAVLKHHWPMVHNWGDFTKIPGRAMRGCADVLVGGTPCQAFSVADFCTESDRIKRTTPCADVDQVRMVVGL